MLYSWYIQLSSDTSYDKIKHLVEIDDDIFAVFTINSTGEAYGLTVAKNIGFETSLVENIYTNINKIPKQNDKIDILTNSSSSSDILGRLKWKVIEYEKIRILQIADKNKIVVVLIKSNTTLDETVDNILGYYYEEEEEDNIPKSLF